jgi:hypothetical protein
MPLAIINFTSNSSTGAGINKSIIAWVLYAKLFKRRLPPSRGSRIVRWYWLGHSPAFFSRSDWLYIRRTAFHPKETRVSGALLFFTLADGHYYLGTLGLIFMESQWSAGGGVWVMTSAPPRGDSATAVAAGSQQESERREWQSVNATNQALPTEIMERVIEIAPRFHVQSEWVTRHVPLPALNIVITGNHPPFICWKREIYKKEWRIKG